MGVLTLTDVAYDYSTGTPFAKRALDGINLTFADNCITGLMGHTGSGKSTLVQLLNGLLRPTEGKVTLDGQDIFAKPKEMRAIRFRVGLVFQYPEYQLFEETVYRDIAFGPTNMGLSKEEVHARVMQACKFAAVGEELLEKSPFDLSGGQKRRVAIAGVLAMQPEVLILDEPAAGLDPVGREEILGGVRAYQRARGSSVIIVSHSMEDIARYCDRLVVLKDGKLLLDDTCKNVFAHADLLRSVGLGVPQITRFFTALAARGIPVPCDIYTVDDGVAAVRALLAKRGEAHTC